MPIDFVAIDFETANPARASACAVGLARVRDGRVVEQTEWFIDPPGGRSFSSRLTALHGITAEHVVGAPDWVRTLQMLDRFVGGDDVVSYTPFDRQVFDAANAMHMVRRADLTWRDGCALAKARYVPGEHGLANHKLPSMARLFGLGDFAHHRAVDDAVICAQVVARIAADHGVEDWSLLWDFESRTAPVTSIARRTRAALPIRNEAADPSHPLYGEVLCFSGDLERFSREEAQTIVADLGATVGGGVTKKTTLVVTGQFDPATLRAGAARSSKVQRALDLAAAGQRVEVIDEARFVELISLHTPMYA